MSARATRLRLGAADGLAVARDLVQAVDDREVAPAGLALGDLALAVFPAGHAAVPRAGACALWWCGGGGARWAPLSPGRGGGAVFLVRDGGRDGVDDERHGRGPV